MTHSRIYLDHNASAPLRDEVARAMTESFAKVGNASSVHAEGRQARATLEQARAAVAALAGCIPAGVVFTGGGTEANNMAIHGVVAAGHVERLLVSAIEHPCVRAAADAAAVPVSEIPVRGDGVVDTSALEELLVQGPGRALVSVMAANNETGAVQPVADVAAISARHGALCHVDAVQAAGRLPLEFAALGIDLMSLSAHKIGGPQGVGALVVRDGLTLTPLTVGGGQELGRRAGTQNVAAIVGFGVAAELAGAELAAVSAMASRRDRMEAELRARAPDLCVFAGAAPRLANTSCFSAPGLDAETLVIALDLAGVAVSAGAACSSGKVARSHVLAAMGVDDRLAGGAIRVSLGATTTQAQTDRLVDAWAVAAARQRAGRERAA